MCFATFLATPSVILGTHACKWSYRIVFVARVPSNILTSLFTAGRAMATCCYPRCIAVYDVVRFCPKCEASFAVCASHRHAHLQCPWPTLSGIQCLAHVPMDRHSRAPLTHGPMYVCLPAHAGEPPGLHCLAGTEHVSKARRSGESPNTEVRDGQGAPHCQPCTKKLTANV